MELLIVRKKDAHTWVVDNPELAHHTVEFHSLSASESEARHALYAALQDQIPDDAYTSELTTEDARAEAFKKIDARSKELIRAGFEYEGVRFSLSLEAQSRYNGMLTAASGGMLELPLEINSLDDRESVTLENNADVVAFCIAALTHIKNVVNSGTVQKNAVRAMQDAEEALAYEDPR